MVSDRWEGESTDAKGEENNPGHHYHQKKKMTDEEKGLAMVYEAMVSQFFF